MALVELEGTDGKLVVEVTLKGSPKVEEALVGLLQALTAWLRGSWTLTRKD